MSLHPSVRLGAAGRHRHVDQRGYYAPPYVSCMFAALVILLEHAGYRVHTPRDRAATPPPNFVWALHKASGAALDSGTNNEHTRTALRALLPDAPVRFGSFAPAELVAGLRAGRAFRVTAHNQALPRYLQRWCGYGVRVGHAYAIDGARAADTGLEVHWHDPMGPRLATGGYAGEWVPWADVRPHLHRNAEGLIGAAFTERDGAIPPPPPPEEAAVNLSELADAFGFRATVPASTPVLDPATLKVVTRIAASDQLRCLGALERGGTLYYPCLVATARVPGPDPKVLLVEARHVSGAPAGAAEATLRDQLAKITLASEADVADVQAALDALDRVLGRHGIVDG